MEIIGKYSIRYSKGFVQSKNLISAADYSKYKELNSIKSGLQSKMKGKREKDPNLVNEFKKVKEELKPFSSPFFVVGSPMYEAIKTGIIKIDPPSGNAGEYPAKFEKVEFPDLPTDPNDEFFE